MKRAPMAVAGVVGLAVGSLALFALLRPRDLGEERVWIARQVGDDPRATAAYRELMRASDAAFDLNRLVTRVESRDLARAFALSTSSATRGSVTPALRVVADAGVPEEVRAHFEDVARAELTAIGATVPRHPIGIRLVIVDRTRRGVFDRAVVIPEREGAPCVIIVRLRDQHATWRVRSSERILSSCAFYAKFGAAGAGMRRWLVATGLSRALFLQPPALVGDDTSRVSLPRFGYAALEACRAGRAEGCTAHFTPTVVAPANRRRQGIGDDGSDTRVPGVALPMRYMMGARRAMLSAGLLAGLAAQLGDERFGRIWRSESSPEEAFAAQEGSSIGAWTSGFVAARTEPYRAGPWIGVGVALFALLATALAAGATIRFAPRELS